MKWDTHPGLAPDKIGFADRQLVDFAMCVNEMGQVRGTCTHPAGFTGLNAAGYIITCTAHSSKLDPPAGVAPASSSLRKKCISGSATEE
jgi:hypothetical protein